MREGLQLSSNQMELDEVEAGRGAVRARLD